MERGCGKGPQPGHAFETQTLRNVWVCLVGDPRPDLMPVGGCGVSFRDIPTVDYSVRI